MDSIITGVIGTGIFLLFVGGLAQSIATLPFTIIVVIICCAAVYGLYEDIKADQENRQD